MRKKEKGERKEGEKEDNWRVQGKTENHGRKRRKGRGKEERRGRMMGGR